MKQSRSPPVASDWQARQVLKLVFLSQGADVSLCRLSDDLMFAGATGYECAIVFDIRGGRSRMRAVSRGTVADIGQFSLEKDDARSHQAFGQGHEFSAFKLQDVETGGPVLGFADGRVRSNVRHADPIQASNTKGSIGLCLSEPKSAQAIHV